MSLYRTYRPQTYQAVVGQESAVQTFVGAILSNRIGHAYVLTGPRGTGKTTLARLFTKAVNCLDIKSGAPCGACANCLAVEAGNFLDLIEINGADNRKIDDIREVIEKARYMPNVGKYKVYLIDEVHMLTKEAFNALLKTLEEPPAHVIFMLATTEINKIPVTILSRCQRIDLGLIPPAILKSALEKIVVAEKMQVGSDDLDRVVDLSGGSFRDALSVLDRVQSFVASNEGSVSIEAIFGIPEKENLIRILQLLAAFDIKGAIALFQEMVESGIDPENILKGLLQSARHQLLIGYGVVADPEHDLKMATSSLDHFVRELLAMNEKRSLYLAPRFLFELACTRAFGARAEMEGPGTLPAEKQQVVAPATVTKPAEAIPEAQIPEVLDVPTAAATLSQATNENQATPTASTPWSEALAHFKQHAMTLYMFLVGARPVIDDNTKTIQVQFENQFYLKKAEERKNIETIKEILAQYFPEYEVTLAVAEKEAKKEANIIDHAVELFDGELIG